MDESVEQQVTYFGALCRRLDTNWHVLRDCHLRAQEEQYTIPLIIVHRAFGVGLFALRVEEHSAAELAIRLTRAMLNECGLEKRFAGFLPVIFLTADPADPRDIRERVARAFNREPDLSITDPNWADWVALTLGRVAAEGKQGGAPDAAAGPPREEPTIEDPGHSSGNPRERYVRWFSAVAMPALVLTNVAVIAWEWLLPAVTATAPPTGAAHDCSGRLITEECTAEYIGVSREEFRRKYDSLRAAGFPAAEALTGSFDRVAVDRWIDHRARQPN